jgi:predicted HAD superfamily phosphohydrolase YqeG
VKVAYERLAEPRDLLRRAWELSARTIILDVEPLIAYWDSGQEALDAGIAQVISQVAAGPELLVVCFSTNSARSPSVVPRAGASGSSGPRVVYLASAHKPFRTAPYRDFPRPGVVIGDQVATDGILARRLGYTFLHYCPDLAHAPAGPRLMNDLGRPLEPLLFTRHG